MVRQWHSLPGEVVDASFLKVIKAKLHEALGNLIWWVVSCAVQRDWN